MQRTGTEWVFRLLQAPKRMARRYLVRGPRIFRLLFNAEIMLREVTVPVPNLVHIAPAQSASGQASESIYLQPVITSSQTELSKVNAST